MALLPYLTNFSRTLTTALHFINLFLVIGFSGVSVAEFDDAFVEISGEIKNLSENNKQQHGNETLVKTSGGKFSRIGNKKSVEGELHEISGDEEVNNEDNKYDDSQSQTIPTIPWIAFLHIPATEYGTSHETSSSVIDKIKNAMLFGASAILIFTAHKKVFKQLDISQIFSHPVILIRDKHLDKVKQEYKRGRKLYVKITDNSSSCKKYVQMFSTVTLWSTCFRPSEGSGVICPPSSTPDQNTSDSLGNFWSTWTSFMAFILCLCLLIKVKFQQWQEEYWMQQVEKTLQQLAREALSNMKTRTLTSSACGKLAKDQSDVCAVCLDEFFSGQVVRVLHCRHEFHTTCVDPWLLIRRTCPLCKHDIIGGQSLTSPAE